MLPYQLKKGKNTKISPRSPRTRSQIRANTTSADSPLVPADQPTVTNMTSNEVNKIPGVDPNYPNDAKNENYMTTEQMIRDLWADMKTIKRDFKGVSDSIQTSKSEQKQSYTELNTKLDEYLQKNEDLVFKLQLANDQIVTLESCYVDLYQENRRFKNNKKAYNIIVKGIPETLNERMQEVMGEFFDATNSPLSYIHTDGAMRIGKLGI